MKLLYAFLGLIAALTRSLSRLRVNFIPLSWAAMAGLGVLAFVAAGEVLDGFNNGATPQVVKLSQVLDHTNAGQNYVSVQGEMLPEIAMQYGDRQRGAGEDAPLKKVDNTWVPMLDKESRRLLIVETASNDLKPEHYAATVTGMLRPMTSKVRDELNKDGGTIGQVPVDMTQILVEGQQPHSPWLWIGIGALALGTLSGMVYTTARRYVVFQPTANVALAPSANPWSNAPGTSLASVPSAGMPSAGMPPMGASPMGTPAAGMPSSATPATMVPPPMSGDAYPSGSAYPPSSTYPVPDVYAMSGAYAANPPGAAMPGMGAPPVLEALPVRVTGYYGLAGNTSQHFVEMPARFGLSGSGDLFFVSNIDASSRFYGVKTNNRAGLWELLVPRAETRDLQPGRLYNGLASRPALRLNYTAQNRPLAMIVSFDSEGERLQMVQYLNTIAGDILSA